MKAPYWLTTSAFLAITLALGGCDSLECRDKMRVLCKEACDCTGTGNCITVDGYVSYHFNDLDHCWDHYDAANCGSSSSVNHNKCASAAKQATCSDETDGRALVLPGECQDD